MPIHFSSSRMESVMASHEAWFEGRLGRDLLSVVIFGAHDDGRKAPAETLSQRNCADLSVPAEDIIEAYDIALSGNEYLGDSYPRIGFEFFGPGVLAAFCGGKLDNSSGAVWFFPPDYMTEDTPLSELHIVYDPDNIYARRIKDLYRAGVSRWQGKVIMGMPDLGGIMDVVASMVTSERLLYALIDEPDEVERLVSEAETAWYAAYNDLWSVLAPQKGHTDWNGLLSGKPSYVIQCDFCYMLGTDMFRRFVLPTLRRDCDRLTHTIYHLDGVGELTHLDDVLSIEKLNAVQWVFGAGQPHAFHWIDIYRRIAASGKGIMVVDSPQDYYDVASQVDGRIYSRFGFGKDGIKEAEKLLKFRNGTTEYYTE